MTSAAGALSDTEASLRDAIVARADTMLADLATHVAIPTGHNHTPGLDEYRELLLTRLRAIDASIEMVQGQPKPAWLIGGDDPVIAPIAICRSPAMHRGDVPPGGARVLIVCHLDTVFDPAGDFQTMTIAPDGKTAVGPGVVDMKGGVLTTINALEALHEAGEDVPWTLMLTSDEETGSYCSDAAIRAQARQHDIGLATEPALPGGELAVARMGSGQFRLVATGRSAHVGRNFTAGVSAVVALAKAIVELSEVPEPDRGRIVSVGPVVGGQAVNAVPDRALAWGNARFPDNRIAGEIIEALDALKRSADLDAGVAGVEVDHCFARPAKPLTAETRSLALIARAAAESLGQELPFASTGGVCDGNILQDAGLPTIDTVGVRGGGLHTTDEWIEIPSLVERSQLMAVLLARLGRQGLSAPDADERDGDPPLAGA
jgi:glutamate carboxypeptidase